MLLNKPIRGILITCLVCILLTSVALVAYSRIKVDVTFSNTSISCSLSGTFTRELHQDGSTTWSPNKPSSATIHASTTAEGLGKASIKLVSGTVGLVNGSGGTSVPKSKRGERLGNWLTVGLYPHWTLGRKTVVWAGTLIARAPHAPLLRAMFFRCF